MERSKSEIQAKLAALSDVLQTITQRVQVAAAKRAQPAEPEELPRVLLDPHAEAIWKGDCDLLIHSQALELAGEVLHLADADKIYGTVVLAKAKPISLAEFRRLAKQHGITEPERKSRWPKARRLYAYRIEKLEKRETPLLHKTASGEEPFVLEHKRVVTKDDLAELKGEQVSILRQVVALARLHAKACGPAIDQIIRLKAPEGEVLKTLRDVRALGDAIAKEYGDALRLLDVNDDVPESPYAEQRLSIYALSEQLSDRLQLSKGFLPAKTRIIALAEYATHTFEDLFCLEDMLNCEDAPLLCKSYSPRGMPVDALYTEDEHGARIALDPELELYLLEKAEPEGRLPILRVPDGRFYVERLKSGKEAGLLSRSNRELRAGQHQFLVSGQDQQYVWGVINIDHPEDFETLSQLAAERQAGVDPETLREFQNQDSAQYRVFYTPMQLVQAYEPPYVLAQNVTAKRYGPVIEAPLALRKQDRWETPPNEVHDEEGAHNSQPWLDFRTVNPEMLMHLTDDELMALATLARKVLQTDYQGVASGEGATRQDIENALGTIQQEFARRGMTHRVPQQASPTAAPPAAPTEPPAAAPAAPVTKGKYAPVRSGTGARGRHPKLVLKDLMPHLHEEFALRAPFIYITGSLTNQGHTKNDIDVLLRGPLDKATSHVVKFRLGRMLPPEIAKRLSFHGGSPRDGETAIDAAGPFSSHAPIYDLVVRRRKDYKTVVEMRDAGAPILPRAELLKQDSLLWLPPDEAPRGGVIQAHYTDDGCHLDLRMDAGNKLIGYTLFDPASAGARRPGSLVEARKAAAQPALLESAFALPKVPQLKAWGLLDGELGQDYVIPIARPQVSWGVQRSTFHEYFLEKAQGCSGRLVVQLQLADGETIRPAAEGAQGVPFWQARFEESLLPEVLHMGVEVPHGRSCLSHQLKSAVPREFHYWVPEEAEKRCEVRDSLVAEGFFTEENVKLVDGELRRVVTKHYLYLPGKREGFPLTQTAQGEEASDRRRSISNYPPDQPAPRGAPPPPILPSPPTAAQASTEFVDSQVFMDAGQKKKPPRKVRAKVMEVKPAAGNATLKEIVFAIGPIPVTEAKAFSETVQLDGGIFVKAGKFHSAKADCQPDDVLELELGPIMWDEVETNKQRIRCYVAAADVAKGVAATSPCELAKLLEAGERVKTAPERRDAVAKRLFVEQHWVKLLKAETEERYVLGVVLVPGEYDSQGDIYDEEEVKKAAHYFMEQAQNLGLMHRTTLARERIKVVESYLAPVDMEVGGQKVIKGTWLLAAHILDDALWAAVKDGRLTGWSIEGTAVAAELN